MAKNKEELLDYGLIIYQNDDYFKFSIDSVLLAEFVNIKLKDKTLVDFCCGNAPVLMILAKKYDLDFFGVELQKEVYELAQKSIKGNNLAINMINDNIKNISVYFKENSLDIITCNPPYFKNLSTSLKNNNQIKAIARHEVEITLEEIINISYKYLKEHGYFYLVHRADRLIEILNLLSKHKFSVKRLQFVYNSMDSSCCCVLFECVKNGNTDTLVEKPLYINEFLGS